MRGVPKSAVFADWYHLWQTLRWHQLAPLWDQIERCAAGRDRKRPYASTNNYHDQHHLIGVAGEVTYSLASGFPMNWKVDDLRGDGGVDFAGDVQVKTAIYSPENWLAGKVSLIEKPGAAHCEFYVLTLVSLEDKVGSVLGWEYGMRVDVAEREKFGDEWRLIIPAVRLRAGLPPVRETDSHLTSATPPEKHPGA